MISGWLMRDRKRAGGQIGFVETNDRRDFSLTYDCSGIWQVFWVLPLTTWSIEQWEKSYDLKPPGYGKCFEVEIEL